MKPRFRLLFAPLLTATLLLVPVESASASQVDTLFEDIFGIFRHAFEEA